MQDAVERGGRAIQHTPLTFASGPWSDWGNHSMLQPYDCGSL